MTAGLARLVVAPLSGFGAVLAVQVTSGLVQTAGLLATVGPREWATVSVAQTAGLLGATLASSGLMSFGASLVAAASPELRAEALISSVRARAVGYVAVLAVLLPVLSLIAPGSLLVAWAVSASVLAQSLCASWYFTGRGEPLRWLRVEVLPLNVGAIAGVLSTAVSDSTSTFAACYLLGAAAAVTLSVHAVRRDLSPGQAPTQVDVSSFFGCHRSLLTAGAAAGINGQGPAILMAASGAPAVPTYLLLDRLVRYVVTGAAPMVQFTQAWVPAGGPKALAERSRRALVLGAFVAVAAAVLFGTLADPAARLLSSGLIGIDVPERLLFSLLVGVLVLTQVNALAVLLPLGLDRVLAISTSAGAAALLVVGGLAAALGGLRAILVVTLVVEGTVLARQLLAVARRNAS